MAGRIDVNSNAGKITEFKIYLPRLPQVGTHPIES